MDRIKLLLIILFVSCQVINISAQSSGRASYYSNALHGRKMSNGERYNKNDLTCAHRTLPFGTKLRVTNMRNGKQVIVRVTDRGPFVRGRIVDLSYAAARAIGSISAGVASVRIEILKNTPEIPYIDNSSPLEVTEVEYGEAGVCYEFIPEWEKVPEDKPAEIKREVNTKLNRQTNNTGNVKASKPTAPNKARAKAKTISPQNGNGTPHQKAPEKQGEQSSSSWTDFFSKVKNSVTGLFE